MNPNFYDEKRFEYAEVAIVLEDFHYKNKGKFFIPILFPEVSHSLPYSNSSGRASTSNIANYNKKHGIKGYTISNYIELEVPEYIGYFIKDEYNTIKKGTELLIVFVGGEINKPKVIGVN